MEAGETQSRGLGAELDRIGSAVDAGDTDLSRLGFWRVVALIKRDDELIERYAGYRSPYLERRIEALMRRRRTAATSLGKAGRQATRQVARS